MTAWKEDTLLCVQSWVFPSCHDFVLWCFILADLCSCIFLKMIFPEVYKSGRVASIHPDGTLTEDGSAFTSDQSTWPRQRNRCSWDQLRAQLCCVLAKAESQKTRYKSSFGSFFLRPPPVSIEKTQLAFDLSLRLHSYQNEEIWWTLEHVEATAQWDCVWPWFTFRSDLALLGGKPPNEDVFNFWARKPSASAARTCSWVFLTVFPSIYCHKSVFSKTPRRWTSRLHLPGKSNGKRMFHLPWRPNAKRTWPLTNAMQPGCHLLRLPLWYCRGAAPRPAGALHCMVLLCVNWLRTLVSSALRLNAICRKISA